MPHMMRLKRIDVSLSGWVDKQTTDLTVLRSVSHKGKAWLVCLEAMSSFGVLKRLQALHGVELQVTVKPM